MTTLAILRKFAPWLIGVALLFVVLLQRNTITDRNAKLDAANVRVADLTTANRNQKATIDSLSQRRIDNDAIANAVAAKIGTNTVRETQTRTIIEKAIANDPAVRNWASVPVPDSVRAGLRADQ